jgi:DNA anti-recombination protein RmuC
MISSPTPPIHMNTMLNTRNGSQKMTQEHSEHATNSAASHLGNSSDEQQQSNEQQLAKPQQIVSHVFPFMLRSHLMPRLQQQKNNAKTTKPPSELKRFG